MNEMQAPEMPDSIEGGLALLESEVADLKEMNASLRARLEEAERRAEYRKRAAKILAIPLPENA